MTLITLPAPSNVDGSITVDAQGHFKTSDGEGVARDVLRMTHNGRLSVPAMCAFMKELRQCEDIALAAHSKAETLHGVQGDCPEKDDTEKAVAVATDKVLRLLAWIAAVRPSAPADIGLQIRAIMDINGKGGCIRLDEFDAILAASAALISGNQNRHLSESDFV